MLTQRVREEMARFWTHVGTLAERIDVDDPVAAGRKLDRRTAASLLRELKLDPAARWLLEHESRHAFALQP